MTIFTEAELQEITKRATAPCFNFDQICGVLGILKTGDIKLPWVILVEEIRVHCRNGTHEAWATANIRAYRRMAIDAGLLHIGELAGLRDCVNLLA